jgi:CBS domain-containing protein
MHSVVDEVVRRIAAVSSWDDAIAIGRGLPQKAVSLSTDGAEAELIEAALSTILDALTEKFIELSVKEVGPAPASFAWLQLGSLGRQERAISGDQDHALIYAEGATVVDAYFAALAERVVSGLEAAGIPRCPSNVMATHPGFRQSMEGWLDRLRGWMTEAEPSAFYTEIALDYRKAAGSLEEVVPALDQIARSARHNLPFLRRLARLATHQHPPLDFFGNIYLAEIGGGNSVFDVKTTALWPITELARFFALDQGITTPSTYERLRRVAASESEWAESAAHLEQAHRTLQNVRIQHQARQVTQGLAVDNLIDPPSFGSEVVRNIREGLHSIRRVQAGVQNWIDWTL